MPLTLGEKTAQLSAEFGRGILPQHSISDGAAKTVQQWGRDHLTLGDEDDYQNLRVLTWMVGAAASQYAIADWSPYVTQEHADAAIADFSAFSGTALCAP